MARQYNYETPSGMKLVIREPISNDRHNIVTLLKENGPSADELLAFRCVVKINGNPPSDPDPRYLANSWLVRDTSAYLTFFLAMFSLQAEEVEDIREYAKKLRAGQDVPQRDTTRSAQQSDMASAASAPTTSVVESILSLGGDPSPSSNTMQIGFEAGSEFQIEPSLQSMLESDPSNQA